MKANKIVLDSYAVLALLQNESEADQVGKIFA